MLFAGSRDIYPPYGVAHIGHCIDYSAVVVQHSTALVVRPSVCFGGSITAPPAEDNMYVKAPTRGFSDEA